MGSISNDYDCMRCSQCDKSMTTAYFLCETCISTRMDEQTKQEPQNLSKSEIERLIIEKEMEIKNMKYFLDAKEE